MIYIKLFIILLFIYLTSKSFGLILKRRFKIKNESYLGLGYLANIGLFFILELPTMIFKLPTNIFVILGIAHIIISLLAIILNRKELFVFTKKEIIALSITTILLLVFALFVDFGYIDLHDSYYYTLLTNSIKSVTNISLIDPRTNYIGMNNYYKYLSFYYQSGFYGTILNITIPSLVLLWCMSFMNIFFLAITSLTMARMSKKKYVNNIITVFLLTLFLSIIKVPFNFVHMITLVMPFYLIKYAYNSLYKDKKYIYLYYIAFIASFAGSASIVFISFALIYILFITLSIRKEKNDKLYLLALPTLFSAFLIIYESLDNALILIIPIIISIVVGLLIKNDKVNKVLNVIGKAMAVICVILLCALPMIVSHLSIIDELFISKEINPSDKIAQTTCIDEAEINDIYDLNIHGTAMNFVYTNKSSMVSTLLIAVTHSTIKYSGFFFLVLYGLFKRKKEPAYLMSIIFLVTFFNPLARKGIDIIIYNLSGRIMLFFTTYFGVIGFIKLINYFEKNIKLETLKNLWSKLKDKVWYISLVLALFSLIAYICLFKNTDWKNYDLLTKTPKGFYEASEFLNNEIDEKANVFYTSSVLNVSALDNNVNNKIKVINSNDYTSYFSNNKIGNKTYINLYLEDGLRTKPCDIMELINMYEIDYIVASNNVNKNEIESYFETIYDNAGVIILSRR